MYKPVQQCTYCGANLKLDDMRRDDCPYCNTVYPHKSQAAQHADVANQMMGNMMVQQAAIQNQWRQGFGVPPIGMPPPPGAPGHPYAHPHQMAQVQMANVNNMSRNIMLFVVGITVAILLFVAVIMVVVFASF